MKTAQLVTYPEKQRRNWLELSNGTWVLAVICTFWLLPVFNLGYKELVLRYYYYTESAHWVEVPCDIRDIVIKKESSVEPSKDLIDKFFLHSLSYSYIVNGKRYSNARIAQGKFGSVLGLTTRESDLVQQFARGEHRPDWTKTCLINPKNPEMSILRRFPYLIAKGYWIVFFPFGVISIFVLWCYFFAIGKTYQLWKME